MIGKIKGYSICNIGKGMLKKDEIFDEISKKDIMIKEKIQNTLVNNGLIYALKKDKKLKAVYLFNSTVEDRNKILKFSEKVLLEEIQNEIKDKFEKDIIAELSEFVSLEEYLRIEWEDNVIVPKIVKFLKFNIPLGSLLFILGVVFGIIFNDLTMGICIGICLGCGSAVIIKRKDDSDNDLKNK